VTLAPGSQAKLAGELFNYIWTLLEKDVIADLETVRL
jgi:hypothetical protein